MSALRPRVFRLQVVILLLVAVAIVAAVFSSFAAGSGRWVTVASARQLASRGMLLDERYKIYLVQTPDGPIALNQFGDYRHGKVVYCESSKLFEGINAGSKFDRFGYYFAGPATASLRRYPTRLEDGMVQVQLYEPLLRVTRRASLKVVRQPVGPFCVPT